MKALPPEQPPPRIPGIQSMLVRLVLAIYLPAMLAAVALVVLESRSGRAAMEEDLLTRAYELSGTLRQQVEGTEHLLQKLALEIPQSDGNWPAFDRAARRAAAAAGLDAIVLALPSGVQVVNTALPWGAPLPERTPEMLMRGTRAGRPMLHDVTPSPQTGRLMVGVSLPVIRDGRIAYELCGEIEVRRLQRLLASTPEGWIAGIIDSAGVVAARAPHPEQYVGRMATAQVQQQILAAGSGVFETLTLDRVPVLTAFRTFHPAGWTIAVSVPRDRLYAPVWRKAAWLAAGAAILLVLSLWLAMRLRRSIVRSVRTLVEEAMTPPAQPSPAPLSFREANSLRQRLRDNAARLAKAQAEVDRVHSHFQRALVQQMERQQAEIAGELHDNLGSTIAAAAVMLAQAERTAPATARPLLARVQAQLSAAADCVRQLSRGMMPAGSHGGALPSALEQLAANADLGIACCNLRHRGDFTTLPAETASHLYRIAQEAVANAQRHGGVGRIQLTLSRTRGQARLTIDDDGDGYSAPDLCAAAGIGLKSMRARALAIDGEIEFTRSPLGGARVRVTFPLPPAQAVGSGLLAAAEESA